MRATAEESGLFTQQIDSAAVIRILRAVGEQGLRWRKLWDKSDALNSHFLMTRCVEVSLLWISLVQRGTSLAQCAIGCKPTDNQKVQALRSCFFLCYHESNKPVLCHRVITMWAYGSPIRALISAVRLLVNTQ